MSYLVDLLEDPQLSQYSLEYGISLMMNLCLRTSGRREAAAMSDRILTLMVHLLRLDSVQVKTCVHGILYNLFMEEMIRQDAIEMEMPSVLKKLRAQTDECMVGQLDLLIEKLEDGQGIFDRN
jgi:hypothetical protein